MLCALVFGKDESGGGLSFSQETLDGALVLMQDILTKSMAAWWPVLPAHWFRPMVHL
jgi:hypothetical protein|eukprot:COSAG06_NODE_18795_length_868_cov_2.048114_2_plen_57_part_00